MRDEYEVAVETRMWAAGEAMRIAEVARSSEIHLPLENIERWAIRLTNFALHGSFDGVAEKMIWFRQYVIGTGRIKQCQITESQAKAMMADGGCHADQFCEEPFQDVVVG